MHLFDNNEGECAIVRLRPDKPIAPHIHFAGHMAFIDLTDSHNRTARLQANKVTRLNLLLHCSNYLSLIWGGRMSQNEDSYGWKNTIGVSSNEDFCYGQENPLQLGQVVVLNSGSPKMLVVDTQANLTTAGWYDESGAAQEISLPPACFHRASPL